MIIAIAPDSFKGSLESVDAAKAIEKGVKRLSGKITTRMLPVADGGEGTVKAIIYAARGTIHRATVTGPLAKRIKSFYGILADKETAIIEMASASGLNLVPPRKRNPLRTTTFGTGELIAKALKKNVREIVLGIGDSATVDGGVGMAQALGIRFLDKRNRPVPFGGGALGRIVKIDMQSCNKALRHTAINVACDVTNPLIGKNGAARVYAPQKGATVRQVRLLDKNLSHLAHVIREELGIDVAKIPGGGAAGGLGAGLVAFLGAKLLPGFDAIAKAIHLEEKISGCDLVITGEGRLDKQTTFGKAPIGVAKLAKKYNIAVVALCGTAEKSTHLLHKHGIDAFFSIANGPMLPEDAIKNARNLLADTAEQVVKLFLSGKRHRTTYKPL